METRDQQIDVLARTIYGEARGELYGGKVAVGCVVRNRVREPGWWGNGYEGVCWKPFQFSCWNDGDPNHALIRAVTAADPIFEECRLIAAAIIDDSLPDVTLGSTHYCTIHAQPKWRLGKTPTIQIGGHYLFNNID